MANVDRPFGLRAAEHLDGSPYNGATRRVYIPATETDSIYLGSPVKSVGEANDEGIPQVELADPGDALLGVVISFEPDRDNLSLQYSEGGKARYAKVVTAPDVIFEVQADDSLPLANVGDLADLTAESGSNVSGISTVELNVATAGTGTQVRVLSFVEREDNDPGEDNAVVRVLIVDHEMKATS